MQQVYKIRDVGGGKRPLTPADNAANIMNRRLEPQTKEILNAVAHNDYVAVHSGRGCTKTTSLAMAALWFNYTRQNSKVIVTGPKYDQLKATIWAEIAKWLQMSNLCDELKWTSERVYHISNPALWFAQLLTSKQKDNIQGIHADHVLWIMDEASNVEDDIFDAVYGGMTDFESKILIAGNLTKTSGFFYRITQLDSSGWKILHFSSEDSDRKNLKWFQSMQRFPRDSDMYRVYVLGLPPKGSPRSIITIAQCEAAKLRDIKKIDRRLTYVPLEIGLDPAAEGNDLTAIAVRFGMKLLEVRVFTKTQAPEVVLQTLKIAREYRKKLNFPHKISVKCDDTAYGNAIRHFLTLEGDKENIEVIGIQFGGKGDDNYSDMATKMWFHMADIMDEVSIPDDQELIEELSAREWLPAGSNKMKVEPKHEYKKRLARSPDRADACILAFWDGTKKIFSKREEAQESTTRTFSVDWYLKEILNFEFDGVRMIDCIHIVALVLSEDISITGVGGIYEYYTNKLWLYRELHYDLPIAEVISKDVKTESKIGLYKDSREARIIGNSLMFRKSQDRKPFGEILRHEGLRVNEPLHYDEYGAIALGVALYKQEKIIVHRNMQNTRQQLGEWNIRDGKPDKKGYENCEAILLILSEVKRMVKDLPKSKGIRDYKPLIEPVQERFSFTQWMRH